MKQQTTLLLAAISGALSVILGAFGAHFLKAMLSANRMLEAYETAVRYQFYHTLALLLAGTLMNHIQNKFMRLAALCWACGILLFSGSLYAMSFRAPRAVAFLTPVGGLFFIAGWAFLFWSVLRNKKGP